MGTYRKSVMTSGLAALFLLSALDGLSAANLSYNAVLPVYLKLNKYLVPEEFVDSYMKTYRSEIWERYKDDEFELDAKRQESFALMKDWIASADTAEQFTIETSMDFGEYDFNSQKFSFTPLRNGTYFSVKQSGWTDFPSEIKVFFENSSEIDGISMEKEKAKAFINSLRDDSGYVRRDLKAKITFHLTDVRAVGEVVASIRSLELFHKYSGELVSGINLDKVPN